MSAKTLQKCITFFILFVFFAIVGFGLGHFFGMEIKSDGTMGGCLFIGETETCPMTFVQHISAWQHLFVAAPQKPIAAPLILMLLAVAIALVVSRNFFWKEWFERSLVLKLYLRAHPLLPLYNILHELFSRGILHARIYNNTIF